MIRTASPLPDNGAETLRVNGARLVGDRSGGLYWPAQATLAVADLHLEKGSSYAVRGQFLPPYDSAATLAGLEALVARYRPERVICLGDSFHDDGAAARLSDGDAARLAALAEGRDWVWIRGNHDPRPPRDRGGRIARALTLGPLVFRHEAEAGSPGCGEVSGHFHPKASVKLKVERITSRCFVTDGRRLILPAFGAYTGGLNVRDPAIAGLFGKDFEVLVLGRRGLYRFPGRALLPLPRNNSRVKGAAGGISRRLSRCRGGTR